ncbi:MULTISPECIES: thioesterase II family protein [unclassified Streptomyces]|uniref:thioesterase II family protein n=1 Tax=unclassified Streptomyces TaxID=2593676 RepID=UPI00224E437C|nr:MULTISPECIES: alpha/beta fold hydrolase [unclassified Streptomyces]MCX4884634.1 alpha/beta fold hydrolase [Streptomyces sp. NBC_00847]MCX5424781.1 alpha/beta fold hydrolase [Streptomyces sp. NBC_00078]
MTGPIGTEQRLRARLADLPPERRARLVERLRQGRAQTPGAPAWFVRHGSADPALRLFCFSYAGGGTTVFHAWSGHLPDQVEVCAIQLPGRESRAAEPSYRRLAPLVADLHTAITPLLDRPFALFGHSMGALVAFELARQLRRAGAPQPERMLLAAFRAPQLPNPNIKIHHLPDEVLKTVLAKEGTPQNVLDNDELMRALLPTLRADFELCDTYEYVAEAPLSVPVSVFGGRHDVRVGRADLEQWKVQADNEFDLTMLPGSHFFIHSSQDLLLAQLAAELQSTMISEGDVPA